jgi:benzodiazapine receptor
MNKYLPYILFVVAVVAIGSLIGTMNIPDEWYQSLNKASFNPPNWVFAPVWTVLYILIGIAGARTWLMGGFSRRFQVWLAQMGLNFLWSPVFFSIKSPVLALIVVVAMWFAVAAFMKCSKNRDPVSFWLFVPYIAWVSFATLLTASVVYLN